MANKDLQSLRFPGLDDRFVIKGFSDNAKTALLNCFEHVAWTDVHGAEYVTALQNALYENDITGITAVYTQSGTVYDTDTLNSLKSDLVVTATYSHSSTQTVTDYTLSGTLTAGTSTITVSYGGYDTTFTVTVTHQAGVYAVTNTLTGCTNSNSATSVTENDPYSATISASSGYTLTGATVSITMGGTDITSTAYSNGTITIASVTGALVVSISAVAVTLSSISAVYTQSGTVYDTDTLDSLKDDLVVTATYSDSSTAAVTDYTLSGTLTAGTSTITVSYGGKTDTFTVTVTQAVEELWIEQLGNTGSIADYQYAPFVLPTTTYNYDYTKEISAIEADFTATGDISIGYCSVGVPSGAYDDTLITYIETLVVNTTGVSKLELSVPMSIPSGYAIVIGKHNTDTAKFKYGGTLSDGFIYNDKYGQWHTQSKYLGINIYRK